MDPQIRQAGPGSCPICGMNLEPLHAIDSEESDYQKMRLRFWVGVFLTIPIVVLTMLKERPYFKWIEFILCTPVIFYCGWPFIKRGVESFAHMSLNMFSLILLGIFTAYFYSLFALFFPQFFFGKPPVYFEVASVITVLVLLGQVLEMKARSKTGYAIKMLLGKAAKSAHVIREGIEKEISISDVEIGDLIKVKPGEKIPVDGLIVDGKTVIDESMITGESIPVEKEKNASVIGGTINQTGSFIMRAEKVGSETLLSRIIEHVSMSQRSKAPIQSLADRVSKYFVPIVVVVAIITFFMWFFFGPKPSLSYAILTSVSVLIIACPCALGLSTPISIMVGMGRGAESGLLIKNAEALEKLEKVRTLVVDKTGTLTEGNLKLTQIIVQGHFSKTEILQFAAAVERNSEHPIAKAVLDAAKEKQIFIPEVENFKAIPGVGISGTVDGRTVFVGRLDEGKSSIVIDKNVAGTLIFQDKIKESTPDAIAMLHRKGIKIIMLTGDHRESAREVANTLKIDDFISEIKPLEKEEFVKKEKTKGSLVAMAGDGINDAPALALADVGIAMGTGTDIAIETAEVTLVKGDLRGIARLINLSRGTMTNIRENLFFSFFYNIVLIPIAAGVLYPFTKTLLNPMLAALAMSLSSVSVVLNALRLRYLKL